MIQLKNTLESYINSYQTRVLGQDLKKKHKNAVEEKILRSLNSSFNFIARAIEGPKDLSKLN